MQDVYFTSNWLLKHPSAVKRHKLKWDDELGKAAFYLPKHRLALVRHNVEEVLFNETRLKPILVDPLDVGLVRSSALQANWYGNRTGMRNGRWLQIAVPFSGSAVLWRQRPSIDFNPVLRGRVFDDKILLQMDFLADDWEKMDSFLHPLFEQARAALSLQHSYIEEHNEALRQYVPAYVDKQRAYIEQRLKAYSC